MQVARSAPVLVGARWDEPTQCVRMNRAFRAGLIDYVEANYPVNSGQVPSVYPEIPIYIHCPINPLASPQGVNPRIAQQIRQAADDFDSPWIGEHLCWAGPDIEGRLGYIVSPLFCPEFVEVAVRNVRSLSAFYRRPIALELAPVYQRTGSMESEMHFLGAVAEEADSYIILDIAHWFISNRNLRRPVDYGIDQLPVQRVVELHIAGIRPGQDGRWWHDSHDRVPEQEIFDAVGDFVQRLPSVRAVTLEHADSAPESDFLKSLDMLRSVLS